ncbi:MAG TPA: hypothetical protein VGG28_28075, partial [Kofleriaceae bacterium]
MTTPKWHENRRSVGMLALAAVACLAFATLSGQWLVNDGLDMTFGLRDNAMCDAAGICVSTSNGDFVEQIKLIGPELASSTFPIMGWITTVTCLLAALGLALGAALALANKQPNLPLSPSTIAIVAIMAGLVTGCVFVATKPGHALGVGIGFTI